MAAIKADRDAGLVAARMRDLTDAALADMQGGVQHYVRNGQAHKAAVNGAAVLGTSEG